MHVVDEVGETLSLGVCLPTFIRKEHRRGSMERRTEDGHIESPVQVVEVRILHPGTAVMLYGKDKPTEKTGQCYNWKIKRR